MNIIFFTIVFCTLFSCTESLCDQLNKIVVSDTMYVFYPFRYSRRQYQYAQDIERRIVLVKDGEVLHNEAEIAVGFPYSVGFVSEDFFFFTPKNSTFSIVKRIRDTEKCRKQKYFVLKPLDIGDTL